MLDGVEREKIINDLATVLGQSGKVRHFITMAISDLAEQSRFLQVLPLELGTAADAARSTINLCLKDGWRAKPSWLEHILLRMNLTQQQPYIQALVARLSTGIGPAPNPFGNYWIRDQHPFFDRTLLRDACKRLLISDTMPVLTVSGPASAGYSYTARVLDEFASMLATPSRVAQVRIPSDYPALYALTELVAELGSQIPCSGSCNVPAQSGSTYATQLVRWLVRMVEDANEVVVFVIEGACQQGVSADINAFVTGLANRICSASVRKKARLVLINHPERLPSILPGDLIEEVVQDPRNLTESDLLPCLHELNGIRLKAGRGALPVDLDALATAMLEQAPQAGSARLRHLHDQLHTLLKGA